MQDSREIVPEEVKSQSMARLESLGMSLEEDLPVMEVGEDDCAQLARDVARKAVVLTYLVGIGYGAKPVKIKKAFKDYTLWDFVSDEENALLKKSRFTEQEQINAQWLLEGVQACAWCLNLLEMSPEESYADDLASHFPKLYTPPRDFIHHAELRTGAEIFAEADFYYRLHAAAREAREAGREFRISESLIVERRRVLDWVIGSEEDWDEVLNDADQES